MNDLLLILFLRVFCFLPSLESNFVTMENELIVPLVMQVDVGDFLRFKSCVLYTEAENSDRPLIHVEVVAHVTRPELRSSEVGFN